MTNLKCDMENLSPMVGIDMVPDGRPHREEGPLPDTTTPHRVCYWALWGEKTGKLRIRIIVGSGA
jgi:hypothetical protein